MTTVLLSAGDASGDQHGADFVCAFRKRRPDARFLGLGGPAMAEAGVELVADQRDLAVGGLVELVPSLGRVASAWRLLGAAARKARPDLFVLVDSGGFNLPFAAKMRRQLGAPILYYIAPQVWAWRPGRIRKLAARVDRLAVIFPFEPAVYHGTGLRVDFVGHPLVEPLASLRAALPPDKARALIGMDGPGPIVALLPGSRRNEIAFHLPVQLETARALHEGDPAMRFALALAPSLDEHAVRAQCESLLPEGFPIRILPGLAREAILAADVVLAKPGTVTLESALLDRPMVVMGRANALTAWILRRALRVPWLAMPNLIAEEQIVPELLQQDAVPEKLVPPIRELLAGPARTAQLEGLARVRDLLGGGGAVERACSIAEEMLATART